jgi:hypothetical protein
MLSVIFAEAKVVGLDNIILGGISQGAATAVWALLCCGAKVGAFLGLCSWLPFADDVDASKKLLGTKVNYFNLILGSGTMTNKEALLKFAHGLATCTDLNLGEAGPASDTPVLLGHDGVVPIKNGRGL